MIAEGKLWEGVELLCLSDKVFDACIYLQSCQNWDSSLWLAKCRLGNSAQHRDSLSKGSIDSLLTGIYLAWKKLRKKNFLKIILSIIGQFDKILLLFALFYNWQLFCYSQIDKVTEIH